MPNIDKLEIAKFDADGMLEKILKFPQQLSHALELAKSRKVSLNNEIIQNICICGMGGSAIGGDLVRSCFNDYIDIPFSVNRYYRVPNFINENRRVSKDSPWLLISMIESTVCFSTIFRVNSIRLPA